MGLLDSLFNQGTYGGQGGGLLDFLRQSQMQQEQYQPSAGFPGQASPMAVGGYQMPRIGDQAQFTPPPQDPAALPPNAQPAQGQLPMQAPQQPDMGDRFLSGIRALGNPGGMLNRLADAGAAFSGGSTQANQTAQFLVSKGIDPAMAKTIVSDPSLLRTVLPSLLGGKKTDDILEHERAQQDPAFAKFLQSKRATTGEYGLNYVYGVDKDGKTVAFAPGKSGDPKRIQFPEGVEIARGIETVNTPTEVITRDKQSGAILGREKKDVAGKEAEEKVGQARGTARASLANGADIDAEATKKKIDELMSSDGFDSIFGSIDQYRPAWALNAAGKDARTRFEQLKGTAFLSAYAMLKGGGAITDIEGQKAGAAMARLDRSLSEDEGRQALKDFKDAVDMGLKKLRRAANGGEEPAAAAAAPKRIRLNADGTIAQ